MHRILLAAALVLGGAMPAMAQSTPYVGQIGTFGFKYCPYGWLPANGAKVPIATYTVLFDVIGTAYGGDGTTTFAVPNLKPIVSKNLSALTTCIAYLGVYPAQG